MRARQAWLQAYRMCRTAASIEDDVRRWAPKFDRPIDIAFGYGDRLAMKGPGYYLGEMRRKRRAIESGGYWIGFKREFAQFNCRCVLSPIDFSEIENGA